MFNNGVNIKIVVDPELDLHDFKEICRYKCLKYEFRNKWWINRRSKG